MKSLASTPPRNSERRSAPSVRNGPRAGIADMMTPITRLVKATILAKPLSGELSEIRLCSRLKQYAQIPEAVGPPANHRHPPILTGTRGWNHRGEAHSPATDQPPMKVEAFCVVRDKKGTHRD